MKIELPLAGMPIVVIACERIIACAIEIGVVQVDGAGLSIEIAGIEIDHIGQHRLASLFGMKRQHFPDRAMFTKGEKQVFRIETVIKPYSRRGVDHCIDRIDDR